MSMGSAFHYSCESNLRICAHFSKIGNKWVWKITTSILIYDLTYVSSGWQTTEHHVECWICWISSTRDFFKQKNTTAISSSTLKCAATCDAFCAIFGSLKSPGSFQLERANVQGLTEDWLQKFRKSGEFLPWEKSPLPQQVDDFFWKSKFCLNIDVFFRLNFPPFSQINAVQQIPPRQIPWWFQFHVPLAGILSPSFAGAHIQQRTSTWRTCRCGVRGNLAIFSPIKQARQVWLSFSRQGKFDEVMKINMKWTTWQVFFWPFWDG